MYNRYQGNSGKYVRVGEGQHAASKPQPPQPPKRAQSSLPEQHRHEAAGSPAPALRLPAFIDGGLGKLLKGSLSGLETEDIILLLILYLMYRESGDTEMLFILGALLLL